MTFSAGSSLKMSWSRGKQSSGWTAFDLKQKNKNIDSEVDKDPFPPIGSSGSIRHGDKLGKKKHVPLKPFSSVLLPNENFPSLSEDGNRQKAVFGYDSDRKSRATTAQEDVNLASKTLKEQHPWAENSLIDDILAAVNNNVDKAVSLLETMASADNFEEYKVSSYPHPRPTISKTSEAHALEMVKDDILFNSSIVGCLQNNEKDPENRNSYSAQKFSDVSNLKYKIDLLNSIPVEPEWEEDDIYISHRKDALKTMRSASRHSKAAANAFLKGEHFSAQQHSSRAREEWNNAEKLNSEAATKILSIRNSDNDISRLDLHGLHAAEAVQALQEYLRRIESQGFSKSSTLSNGVKKNDHAQSTLGSLNFMDWENLDKPLRLRSLALHVITGVGNHSRGQAALPTAVRSFLSENRYRFEEMRPGVITVWPKFRQS